MEVDEIEQILEDRLRWDAPKEEWSSYSFTEIVSGLNFTDRQRYYAKQNLKTILSNRGVNQERKADKRLYKIPPICILNNIKDSNELCH